VPESAYSPEQKRAVDLMKERLGINGLVGPLRVYARNPLVLEGVTNIIDADRKAHNLGHRLTRLVAITAASFWRAQFEWFAQARAAAREGVSPEVIEALRVGKVPQFAKPDEQLVYETVREITETRALSPASFQRARDMLGDQATAELMHFAAFFTMIAITCVTFDVQAPEPFTATPLPPLPVGHRPTK
jgi:4-carboxymuconolactone decarboxylase